MNKPIINPSTLSEVQREKIRKLYANCINSNALLEEQEKANLIKNKVVAFRSTFACGMNDGAMAAMIKLFGVEFFKEGE
jgi:hypothetical protein